MRGSQRTPQKFKPWKLVWYCAFPDKYKALAFEKYLKVALGPRLREKALIAWRSSPIRGAPILP